MKIDRGLIARSTLVMLLGIAVFGAMAVYSRAEAASTDARKQKLAREDTYFEIINDNDDHGNFVELIYVPIANNGNRKVLCVIYSDKIGSNGGGAGMSCNWEAFNQRR